MAMIKLIALLKRKPGITHEEFTRRWLKEHTKLSTKLEGLRGYRINIATQRQPEGDTDTPIYDGTCEMWWDSIEAMEASFATELGKSAGADADGFCSERVHIYTDEFPLVEGPQRPAPRKRAARKSASAKRSPVKRTVKNTTRRMR
jgi:uncharacterized protein (TIGR02118 family)